MNKPWFEERPGILTRELDALKGICSKVEVDEALMKKGVLRVKANLDSVLIGIKEKLDKDYLLVRIVYPDSYPFFRPQVFADDLTLTRHQNVLEKNLCLLGRLTSEWNSQQTVAGLIKEQLPKLLDKGQVTDSEVLKNDPTEQAEPVTEYYATVENGVLFDLSVVPDKDLKSTEPRLLASLSLGVGKEKVFPTRFAVVETTINSTAEIHAITQPLGEIFASRFKGQLYRVPGPPPADPSKTLPWLSAILKENKQAFKLPNNTVPLGQEATIKSVVGLCFEEEKEKGVNGYTCLFHIDAIVKSRPEKGKIQVMRPVQLYARSLDSKPQTANVRAAKLTPLKQKKVSVAGLGALGGFLTLELARSGVGRLAILDNDAVEPATTIRWPLGMSAAGITKVNVLKSFIDFHYPGTNVEPFQWLIGTFQVNSHRDAPVHFNESDILDRFFEDSSLVVDATAEFGVHHFLSQEATKRGVPYISLHASPGAYGGSIMRQIPYRTGCWSCFTHMENEGAIPRLNADDTAGLIQPPGCGDITFTGASVDLQQISLMAARMAISTLCNGEEDGYPSINWDIARVNLFDEKGQFLVPDWKTYRLPVHKDCYYCNY